MRALMKRSAAGLSVLLAGVAVELVLAFVKSEPVSWERFATLFGIILLLSVVLKLAEIRRISWRRIIAGGLVVMGSFAVAAGVVVLLRSELGSNTLINVVGTTMISCGVLIILSGVYTITLRGIVQPDDPDEYKDIAIGKTKRLSRDENSPLLTYFQNEPPDALVRMCQEQMSMADLHFIGYYVESECRFYIDNLANSDMELLRGDLTADERRKRYEAYGRLTKGFIQRLDSIYEEVQQGALLRVVLDVDQGAFYYMRIDPRRFLFAVTLDQDAVNVTDNKTRDLAERIGKLHGLKPENPLKPRSAARGATPSNVTPLHGPKTRANPV